MMIKLLAMGSHYYFDDSFNIFDSIIVAVLLIDTVLYYSSAEGSQVTDIITMFRVVRIVCIFKLAKDWK